MRSKFVWLIGCALVWTISVTAALAGSDKKTASAETAASCAREARSLKGDEQQQKALDECVKAHEAVHDGFHSQQNKMKHCNVEAGRKELHGDERRAFMSSCLKG